MNNTKTHVEVPSDFTIPTNTIKLNNDGIGYVESWDFSRANLSEEHRKYYITKVASICYQNPKAAGSISLYNRLATESASLPSSSFEFVPILLEPGNIQYLSRFLTHDDTPHIIKYGTLIEHDNLNGDSYLLTNLRALMHDIGEQASDSIFFNSEDECKIIKDNFFVFQSKIDLATARQFMRHRVVWQELSRRYVSGSKVNFEFYISDKMKEVYSDQSHAVTSTQKLIDLCVDHYFEAITLGVKPEEARRILPQAMYTTIWSAWMPDQFNSFLKLRLDPHTQIEHRNLAKAMQELTSFEVR